MKIAVLGSCVTRDAIPFVENHNLVFYAARSSILSMMSKPLNICSDEVEVKPDFLRNQVIRDITKTTLDELEAAAPDFVVIDLIDERFDLLEGEGTLLTKSNGLVKSGLAETRFQKFQLLRRSDPKVGESWISGLPKFMSRLRRITPEIHVHRALWTDRFYRQGETLCMEPAQKQRVARANEWLATYYDAMLSDGAKEIPMPNDLRVSDMAHKWGFDYFHFGPGYYQELAARIDAIGMAERDACEG